MKHGMKRTPIRALTVIGALLFGLGLGAGPAAADQPGAPVVVELYTSQGCSSCPPADALLGSLAGRPDVVALAFHVDYWDYIGWKDPYASPDHTRRQRAYQRVLGTRYVYTPQMVIDGHRDVLGSSRRKVEAAIDKAAAHPKRVPLRLDTADGGRAIIPAGHAPAGGADVWLAVFDLEHETDVLRGENHGRQLKNYHVVREFRRIGVWQGEALEFPLDLQTASTLGRGGCAVIVQDRESLRIIGAASVNLVAVASR